MKFGFFAALPGDFDVDVKPSSGGAALSKNVRPLGTAGLLFAPLPYLHVLIGATLSNVAIEPTDAENDQQLWSMFFALGTTIDAVGAAIK